MATARRILLADPDLPAVKALSRSLRARGYQVHYAADGSRALEVAVLRHPDVVLFDERCPLIDAKAFTQILRTNPRTEDIPVVVTTAEEELDRFRGFREGVLKKPYNTDEVLARIDHLCRRAEAARQLTGEAREIEGSLAQLPLVDLVQILSMNRRSGRLTVHREGARGEIHLASGQPINARLGDVEGEKALFRLLGWADGSFAFHPGRPPARQRIVRHMEDLLLEGMRQVDERARLLGNLPPLTGVLAVTEAAHTPIEPHPVTREVLRVLGQPRRLVDILDLADAPDLDLLGAVTSLLDKGLIQIFESTPVEARPVLGPAEIHALRGRLLKGKPSRSTLVAKVALLGTGPRAGRWLLRSVPGFVPAGAEPVCLRSSFGTLGRVEVSEALGLDIVLVPAAEAARPLWRPFLGTAVGGVLLEDGDAQLRLARYCAFELRLPVVVATGRAAGGMVSLVEVPVDLRGAPAGVAAVETDILAALRAVLLIALEAPVAGAADPGPPRLELRGRPSGSTQATHG